jgi:mRNA interferase MazF
MDLNRGDIVIVVASGDMGKPRPAVIVQSDYLNATQETVMVCLMTSDLQATPAFRLTLEPHSSNGLKTRSQIMVDKVTALPRRKIKTRIGALSQSQCTEIDAALRLCLGLI